MSEGPPLAAEVEAGKPPSRHDGRLEHNSLKRFLDRRLARTRAEGWLDVLFVPSVLLIIGVYLSLTNRFFLTQVNITNVLVQGSILGIAAFGATFPILARELDLSIGSVVALVSVISALVMKETGSIPLGFLVGLGTAALIGIINGLIVTLLEVPAFIATFGMLVIANGVALRLTNGGVISGLPDGVGSIANNEFLGLRLIVWLLFAVFAVLFFLQSQTSFGIQVLSVGGNPEAARLSGIPVNRVRFLCFVVSGAAAGVAGIALMARVESGQPNAARLLPLEAVAAIVVGGTSLFGGRGSVARTLWGVLFIATLKNGLDLKGVGDDLKQVILGSVFIAAASVEFFRRQLRRRKAETALARDLNREPSEESGAYPREAVGALEANQRKGQGNHERGGP
jgi:ribose/xylose/arabinose/galactoside ABC-type transport system permease subunit